MQAKTTTISINPFSIGKGNLAFPNVVKILGMPYRKVYAWMRRYWKGKLVEVPMLENHPNINDKAILNLLKLTLDKVVTWDEADSNLVEFQLEGDFEVLGKAYRTIYKDKSFRIYKCRKKVYTNHPRWKCCTELEVIDDKQRLIWTFPYTSVTHDLYYTIHYKMADAGDIYDVLLAED